MHFSPAFLAIVVLILPAFAVNNSLVNVVRSPGATRNRGYVVTFKSDNGRLSFVKKYPNLKYKYSIINAVAGNFTIKQIDEMLDTPHYGIKTVYPDPIATLQAVQRNATWGLARLSSKMKLPYRNSTATNYTYYYNPKSGRNVDIYMLDSGVDTNHSDFGGRARWGVTLGPWSDVDDHGHGTHVAGLAAGTTYGVAKQATIIAVKAFPKNGIRGLEWIYNTTRGSGRRSVACVAAATIGHKPLDDAAEKLVHGNVTVVAAAGNFRDNVKNYSPARVRTVFTVAASNIADLEAIYYTNFGDRVDIFAPGTNIISTWIGSATATYMHSGTSMATGYVTGLVATMLSFADFTPHGVKDLLLHIAQQGVLRKVSDFTPNLLAQNGLGQNQSIIKFPL